MSIRNILTAMAVLFAMNAHAQDIGLKVGDQVPDFTIPKIINSAARTARILDYKDQLLIIDFWSTGCKGCILAMPHMDSLQKQFGDKIKVLPVTTENQIRVSEFWKNNGYTKNTALSSVVEDKLFEGYFRHQTIPHEVWVYKGKVVAITAPEYVEAKNIQKVLNGEQISFPVKNDFYVFDGSKQPLFKSDTNQVDLGGIIRYAAISDYKEGVPGLFSGGSGIFRDTLKKTIRAYFLNQPIFNSYAGFWRNALGRSAALVKPANAFMIGPNEVVWEVTDKNRYTYLSKSLSGYEQDWIRRYGICFEAMYRDNGQSDQEVARSVIKDLDRLLGLNVRWEKRKEKVLVLVKVSSDDKLVKYAENNTRVADIVYQLNQQANNPYVFDGSKIAADRAVPVKIGNWTDVEAIRRAIQPYGLDLIDEERMVDKFVFSEIEGGLLVDGQMLLAAKAKKAAQKGMKEPTGEESKAFLAANKSKPGVVTLPSGLQYKIIKAGTGNKPSLTDKVLVHFEGTLVNGKVFDSSYRKGRAYATKLTNVIKGWTEVLQLMPVGSRWMVYVPAELAYGKGSAQGTIPPNSVLVFELDLLSIVK